MKYPKAQIRAIMRMRLFIQLTHTQHLAPQSAGAWAQAGIQLEWVGFARLFTCLPVCSVEWQWRTSSSGMCCGLYVKIITSLGFKQSRQELILQLILQTHGGSLATSSLCCLQGLGESQLWAEGTEPGIAVGRGGVIRLVPEQTGHSGLELGREGGGLSGAQKTLCPCRFIRPHAYRSQQDRSSEPQQV